MTDTELYDAIVVVTPNDFKRVESNNKRIVDYLPVRKVLFVGSKELGELVAQSSLGDKAGFVDENDIIPFDDVYNCIRDIMSDILLVKMIVAITIIINIWIINSHICTKCLKFTKAVLLYML